MNTLNYSPNLLKLVTMIGMGRVIQRTPHIAHRDPAIKKIQNTINQKSWMQLQILWINYEYELSQI